MRTIEVKVIPNSRKELIEEENGALRIHLKAPAVDGKANKALIEALAEYYKIKKRDIEIIRGETSRSKLVRISSQL